jgi:hypothetical protein
MDQKQQTTSLLIMSAIVSMISKPVEFPKEVKMAKIMQTPDEIPMPRIENGLLLILLMMIYATM